MASLPLISAVNEPSAAARTRSDITAVHLLACLLSNPQQCLAPSATMYSFLKPDLSQVLWQS
jgi:hypothetical protein